MLNWLVIGIGDISTKRVIPAIRSEPRSRLYGVVTRDKAKGAGVAEHIWDNLDAALADREIDAVYVATPVALHAPQTIAALIHHGPSPAQGSFRSWLLDPKLAGGGPLFDVASHRIDLLNYLFGKPVRATGMLSNAVFGWPIEDNATALIEYESGVRGIVDVRWHSDVVRDQFRIIGTKGEINLDPLSGPELVHPGGREQLPTHANIHFPMIENFVAAVLDGAPLLSSGESAIWTDWVTGQVYCPDAALFGSQSTSGTPST